ncbi:SNF2-related protein [Paraburkholderia youngii]|uniref:SNF2-related protein n=1 Tax=Paraburkholderia youngii TaxID=2782701 RepID=UPI001590CFB6|nr:SNF2-related protein [Paraburkholderia youngii]NUX58685.1 ATP-dependent helicase [Paraburkholderia youngii]
MSRIWTPRQYQQHMLDFGLAVPYCQWAVDMGLGKTATAATLIQRSLYDLFDTRRWLIVGPKRVAFKSWPDELKSWLHLLDLPYRILGAEDFGLTPTFEMADAFDAATGDIRPALKKRGLAFGWSESDPAASQRAAKAAAKRRIMGYREHVHIVSYDFLPWLAKALGDTAFYDGLCLDESSMFKNQDTVRFRALRHLRKNAGRVVELTGTPAPRGLLDLWSQFFILDQGERLETTFTEFRHRYFRPDQRGRDGTIYSWKLDPDGRERIYRRIGDISMSLKSEDYLQLPPLIENPIRVALPAAARELYDTVERELIAVLGDSTILAARPAALCQKLLQISNGAVYDEGKRVVQIHDAKLDALEELADVTPGNLLVAYAWKHDAARIQKRLGRRARKLETDRDIDDWNAGKIKVGYGHPASFGHGLNLQHGGSNAVWFGPTYSLELWQQFIKRLHRSGQTAERVIAHVILCDDTLDDHVRYDVIAERDSEQSALLAAVRARLSCSRGNSAAANDSTIILSA